MTEFLLTLFAIIFILQICALVYFVSKLDNKVPKPGLLSLKVLNGEGLMLKFVLMLPEKSAADVVVRELTYSLAGSDPTTVNLNGSATQSAEMLANDNEVITGNLVDVDDAGNRSPARDFSFTIVDTIAPPLPGALGVMVLEEVEPSPGE